MSDSKRLQLRRRAKSMNEIANIHELNHPSDLVITSQSFGLLRKALYENMGKEKAKGFLLRFGKELGSNKAKEIMAQNPSIDFVLNIATQIHKSLGHVSAVELFGSTLVIENGEKKFKSTRGKWINSFEVSLHIENHGLADECSCHTLNGYASGYLSTIYKQEILVRELTCRAKGDADCLFEINTRKYWEEHTDEDLAMYNDQTIIDELESTYDELLSKNELLRKITKYHDQLNNCMVQKNDIENVIRTAYQTLNIPIVIQDLHGNILSLHGLTEDVYQQIIKNNKGKKLIEKYNKSIYKNVGQAHILTTPVYLENKIFAYCSFIYQSPQETDRNDYLFLEKLSSILSLCYLNEKISFETTERLRISILDRLIHKQYLSLNDITAQFKYLAPNIVAPFLTLSIKCIPKQLSPSPIDLYNQLLQLSKTLSFYYVDAFLTQYKDDLIILAFSIKDYDSFCKTLGQVIKEMERKHQDIEYKIGLSRLFHDLAQFDESLIQAEQAAFLPRKQKIIHFDELGFLGMFLQDMNLQKLKVLAKDELGTLLNDDDKNKELLQTLYIYLVNGGRLEKTMKDLSLSLGGIQYRIRKIESIINKNLRDFSSNSYLLLLIESLILFGEIHFE